MPCRFDNRVVLVALACVVPFAIAGCEGKTVHASVPATEPSAAAAGADRPMTTAPDTDATPPTDVAASPPPAIPAPPTSPASVAIPGQPAPVPRRPTGSQPSSEGESESAPRQPALQITPYLNPGDQASYQRKTADDLTVAQKNLDQTAGKQLSAAQQDLVAKITSFSAQSRDAGKSGDWVRAQNLAQKARLLSVELLNSL